MDSPSVIANFFIKKFVIWKHGKEKLHQFLRHLNFYHSNIKFTMELEKENQISFLDVLLIRVGEHLDYRVYRKP